MDDFWDELEEEPTASLGETSLVLAQPGAETRIPPSVALPPAVAPIECPPVEVVERQQLVKQQDASDRLRRMETEVLEDSLRVISSALDFSKVMRVDEESGELAALKAPPEDWIAKYGAEGAQQRFIIARSACMDAKNAPVGLKMAQQTAVGAMAALDRAKQGQVVFNLQFVKMVAPPMFEEIEIVEAG